MRLILSAPALLYTLIMTLRNRLYDWGILSHAVLPVPVICVGNITVGGTGKTPMVIWICRYLQSQGRKVAIVSRGYKGTSTGDNDETKLLRQALPHVAMVVDSDRVAAARQAIDKYQADVIVMDDGLQHRRLARDLDLVMIDATCPFGYGWVLPRGLLRESLTGLKRASLLALSRCDIAEPDQVDRVSRQAARLEKDLVKCQHQPCQLKRVRGENAELDSLKGRKVAVFCGLGNPQAFEKTVTALGAEVVARRFKNDHETYDPKVVDELIGMLKDTPAEYILTTEKDWVKLRRFESELQNLNLYILSVEMVISHGQDKLEERLNDLCRRYPANTSR